MSILTRVRRCLVPLVAFTAACVTAWGAEAGLSSKPAQGAQYGVRWKLIEDEAVDYHLPCERIEDAAGLSAKAFDRIFPWSDIRPCKIVKRPDGSTKISCSGDPEFASSSVAGNIMVEIPKHYTRRYVSGGYEYRLISAEALPGFYVDPAFVENGRELDRIYVGAYEAHVTADGKMESVAGVYPTADKTRVEYRKYAKANGTGFGTFDIRTLLLIQNLFLVEHADRNSQRALGNGWGKILQPARTHRCVREEKGANRLITKPRSTKAVATVDNGLFIGCAIQITSYEKPGQVYRTYRTLTGIKRDVPEAGFVSFYFDGSPIDTTTDMCLGGAAQKTGLTDVIAGHSGHGAFRGSPPYDNYRCAVKYRHMENLWGNLWCFIDGLNLSKGRAFFCENMEDYESGVTEKTYHPTAIRQLLQDDNGDIGGSREIHFLKNLGYDPRHPWLALPQDYTYQGIASRADMSTSLRNGNFGDYYYLSANATCYVHGGGFDHYWRCGLFTLRGWSTDSRKWYLYGSRLIFKPLDSRPQSR